MINIQLIDSQEEIERLKGTSYQFSSTESIPDEAIVIGSLGVLASGHLGIIAWRQLREDSSNTSDPINNTSI